MTSRQKRRDEWRLTNKGTWTRSLGYRGCRVRLFEMTKGGSFYRSVYVPGHGQDRVSLSTTDRGEAERMGLALLGHLVTTVGPTAPERMDLEQLSEAFLAECPMFLDNTARSQSEARTRTAILRAGIGEHIDVRTLTEHHVRQYEARRRRGGIRYDAGKVTAVARQRTVQADVKLLKQMLNWACTRPMPGGGCWLDRNPLAHVRVRGEADVRRPVASQERFEATRTGMQAFQTRYLQEMESLDSAAKRARADRRYRSWLRAELGLVLLEATGRRRGAIMGLRWSDLDFASGRITWRAEYDKKRRTSTVCYPERLFATVREFQRRLGALGGCVFPQEQDAEQPAAPELLSQRISQAETAAALPKLDGGTCHPYRRKWRSERSHHPIKAVAVAGGWVDVETMLKCYDQPDDADILAVTSEERKRREGGAPRGAVGPRETD
ncbi:MAG: tyrosine-type recombinase/integrase [Gemmatimonadaceae bacterium]